LLQLSRLTVDTRGRPVEYVRSLYRGDRFRFRQRVQRPREPEPGEPQLRAATGADAEALAAVFVTSWRAGYRSVVPDDVIDGLDEREVAAWLRGLVTDTAQATVVCQAPDGMVIGFVRYGADPTDTRNGHVYALYVHALQSGHGYGRKLLRHALAELDRRGHEAVTLWMFDGNEQALSLYRSEGFEPDGATRVEPQYRANEIRLRREAGA
jgi:ribosomal protein S18 acetylase RimI-like enzyme